MADLKFSDNYSDLSVRSGVHAGFQFEFGCQRCGDTFRSEFVAYRSGQASGWLGKAGSLLGGVLGSVGDAVEGMAESGWGKAHDDAFRAAVEQAKKHFHRCARCSRYFCDACWNGESGLCRDCAPDADVEIEAARAAGRAQAAAEEAAREGAGRGRKADVKRERQLVCPQCGTETKGAKFCPQCGSRLATRATCPRCAAELPADAKFCTECGAGLKA